MGDIHGCDVALDALLDRLALTADDTLVVLGDAVDRGPNTRRVVERLMQAASTCRLIFILGNHEEMMLDALAGGPWDAWLGYGGQETLDSYGGDPNAIPQAHLDFLASGLDYWETPTDIFIHANLEPGVPLEKQTPEWLRWTRLTGLEKPHPSGRRVLCGHTPNPEGIPRVFDGWVCLDTAVCRGGFLTALDVTTDVLYQTDRSGRFRGGFTLQDIVA